MCDITDRFTAKNPRRLITNLAERCAHVMQFPGLVRM